MTNGPNTPNSLYANQLHETGQLTFIDVAEQAGVAALSYYPNTDVCFGDTAGLLTDTQRARLLNSAMCALWDKQLRVAAPAYQ